MRRAAPTILAWASLLALALVLASPGGCKQIVGIDGRSTTCGSLPYAEVECASCMDGACCAEESACRATAGCAEAFACMSGCAAKGAACRVACDAARVPTAAPELDALLECRFSRCANACNTCGGVVDALGASCDTCVEANCCGLSAECADEPACNQAFACISGCKQPDCPNKCLFPRDQTETIAALNACIGQQCPVECAVGRDWTCVEQFAWESPKSTTLVYDVLLRNLFSQDPVPGVAVEVCTAIGNTCHVAGKTGPDGSAKLDVDVPKPLPFTGYLRVGPDGYRPMLLMVNKPLVKDESRTFYLVSDSDFDTLVSQFAVPVDPTRGMVFVTALDCNGFGAPDISFTLSTKDDSTLVSYFNGTTDPSQQKTGKFGTAGFINAPVTTSPATITMLRPGDIPAGATLIGVQASTITEVALYPSPYK